MKILLILLLPVVAFANSYSTNFPKTENPLSENGAWINGGTTGLLWNNMQSAGGRGEGVGPASTAYSDPTAILSGSWGPNQTVTATVYSNGASDNYYQEIELRLRTSISANNINGVEVNFRTPNNGQAYVQIVSWNGGLGSFSYIATSSGKGVSNGDTISASFIGNTISAYINGQLIVSGTNSTFTSGSPGIGVDYGCGNTYGNFGFSSFTATDNNSGGSGNPPPQPPTGLSVTVSPGMASISAGQAAYYTASVSSSGGFYGPIGLSVSGLPYGAAGSFYPAIIQTAGNATLAVATSDNTPPGNYTLTATASSGSLSSTSEVQLAIESGGRHRRF